MERSEKVLLWLLIIFLSVFALFLWGWSSMQEYLHPVPEKILSRMERNDQQSARQIIDDYSRGLEAVATATGLLGDDEYYYYSLNFTSEYAGAENYEEQLKEMPLELADTLRAMEREFPACKESLLLQKGQIGVWLTDDGSGFSFLCYPGGELISRSVIDEEKGTRCLDMGDGWELQMYYAPKG